MKTSKLLEVLGCDLNHLNYLRVRYPARFIYVHKGGLGRHDESEFEDDQLQPLIRLEQAKQEFKKGIL